MTPIVCVIGRVDQQSKTASTEHIVICYLDFPKHPIIMPREIPFYRRVYEKWFLSSTPTFTSGNGGGQDVHFQRATDYLGCFPPYSVRAIFCRTIFCVLF